MTAYFGRRYRFAASHRLFRPEWDELRNQEVFGKCANPFGHGHNYTVEVLVGGAVDSLTGMVMDMVALDDLVHDEVTGPFDHANLNLHPAFANRVPTSENLCIEIFDRLHSRLAQGTLRQVRIEETVNNFFTYTGGLATPGTGGSTR